MRGEGDRIKTTVAGDAELQEKKQESGRLGWLLGWAGEIAKLVDQGRKAAGAR